MLVTMDNSEAPSDKKPAPDVWEKRLEQARSDKQGKPNIAPPDSPMGARDDAMAKANARRSSEADQSDQDGTPQDLISIDDVLQTANLNDRMEMARLRHLQILSLRKANSAGAGDSAAAGTVGQMQASFASTRVQQKETVDTGPVDTGPVDTGPVETGPATATAAIAAPYAPEPERKAKRRLGGMMLLGAAAFVGVLALVYWPFTPDASTPLPVGEQALAAKFAAPGELVLPEIGGVAFQGGIGVSDVKVAIVVPSEAQPGRPVAGAAPDSAMTDIVAAYAVLPGQDRAGQVPNSAAIDAVIQVAADLDIPKFSPPTHGASASVSPEVANWVSVAITPRPGAHLSAAVAPVLFQAPLSSLGVPARATVNIAPLEEPAIAALSTLGQDLPTGMSAPEKLAAMGGLSDPAVAGVSSILVDLIPALTGAPTPNVITIDNLIVNAPASLTDKALDALMGGLKNEGFSFSEPKKVNFTIRKTNVRYFHPEDAAAARAVAGVLGGTARDFISFRPRPSRGTVEVWLAGSGAPRPVARSPQSGNADSPALIQLRNQLLESLRRGDHL